MDNFYYKPLAYLLMLLPCVPAYSSSFDERKLIDLSGYLMLDHDYYGPFYNKDEAVNQHKTAIRRSKLGITFSPNGYFQSKIQLKYARSFPENGEFSLGDTYVRFIHKSNWAFQFGHMKEPFGLEQQTSSSNLLTIERSSASESFAPGRNFGLQVDHKKKAHTFALGYYLDRDSDDKFSLANFNLLQQHSKYDIPAATLRITYAPLLKTQQSIHFGASISRRWLSGNKIQIKQSGEVYSANNIIRSARFYADSSKLYQIDFAWQIKSLLLQSELVKNLITQDDGRVWNYLGAYVQASYQLSGRYKYRYGRYKSQRNMELVVRQSMVDLRDHDIGSEAAFTLLGINYYPSPRIKLMANIIFPEMSGNSINNDQSGQAYSLRIQYKF